MALAACLKLCHIDALSRHSQTVGFSSTQRTPEERLAHSYSTVLRIVTVLSACAEHTAGRYALHDALKYAKVERPSNRTIEIYSRRKPRMKTHTKTHMKNI